MSLTDLAARRASATCPTCLDRRVVTVEGKAQAIARRCPSCFEVCTKCGGAGYTFEDDWTGAPVGHACDCLAVDQRIDLFNAARVPRRYVRASLWPLGAGALDDRGNATPIGTEDVNASLRAATLELGRRTQGFTPGDRGIGLTGPVGCGKTHLMAALVRGLTLDDGVPCRFVEFTHLLAELREGFEHGTGAAGLISQAVEIPVLVIDELGKGLTTEWQMAILDELVSKRYNAQVTTFFTSNYPTEKADRGGASSRERFEVTTLEDRIGARMYSRLLEMCDILAVDAPDYRKRSIR
jgi:DNA replication protein DnaC